MKKILITLILFGCLINSSNVFAKTISALDFSYTSRYECSKERFDGFETNYIELNSMYFIYFDDKDNVVILNDKVIYKSFEDTIEPQLFHRNGGVFSLSYKMIDKTYFFQLKRDPRNLAKKDTVNFPNGDEYSVFSLIFDMSDLTYMIRRLQMNSQDEIVSTSNGTSGTCIKGDFEYL